MKISPSFSPDFSILPASARDHFRMYADIIGYIPIGLYALHLENPDDIRSFKIILGNAAIEKTIGVKPELLVGKYFIDISPETFETGRVEDFRQIILSGQSRELGVSYHPGNALLPENYYNVSAFPLPGNCIGVVLENVTERIRTENKIKEANTFLNSILENIPDMIFVKDAQELRFLRFNKAGEALLGYSRDELIGKNDDDFFPKKEADFFKEKDRQVLKDGKLLEIHEEPIHTRHHGVRWLHTKKIPVRDEKGNPLFLLGISTDITERKKEEEQLYEYKKFFDLSFDMVCIANTDGYFKIISPSFSQTLGYANQELLSKQFIEFVHPDDVPATLAEIEKLKSGAITIDFLNRYRCKDGMYRFLQWVSTPDPKTGEIFAIARDVTEAKLAEEKIITLNKELARAKDELEMKVLKRTAELRETNEGLKLILDKLGRSNQRLEEFAYMSSHNLRAPLANLTSLVAMYSQENEDNIIFDKIQITVNQLNAIVSDLTGLVALDKPVDDKKTIRFEELLDSLKTIIESQIKTCDAKIIADFSTCESITYPYSHLQSILINLLTNAIKYRSSNRSPVIKLKTERAGEYVKLLVSDNGMGIEEKHHDKIFKAFKRLNNEMDGKGLGLYIIKRQLESLGGTIELKSAPGEGSEFTVMLKDNPEIQLA